MKKGTPPKKTAKMAVQKANKDGYTRGPRMVLGPPISPARLEAMVAASAPRDKLSLKKVTLAIHPLHYEILSREAVRRHQPEKEFMGKILESQAQWLR